MEPENTVNRVNYVVFVLPAGLFFFLLFAWCICLVWSIWHLCRKEPSVHFMSSVWWLVLQRRRHSTPTHPDLEHRSRGGLISRVVYTLVVSRGEADYTQEYDP